MEISFRKYIINKKNHIKIVQKYEICTIYRTGNGKIQCICKAPDVERKCYWKYKVR